MNVLAMTSLVVILGSAATEYQCGRSTCPSEKPYCTSVGCVHQCPDHSFVNGTNCVLSCNDGVVDGSVCMENCPEDKNLIFEKIVVRNNEFMTIRVCLKSCDLSGNNLFEYNKTCMQYCPINASYVIGNMCSNACSETHPFMYKTSDNQSYAECVQKCPADKPFNDNYTCVAQCQPRAVLVDKSCYDRCPNSSFVIYNNACLTECPYNTYKTNTSCTNQCISQSLSDSKYIFEKSCLDQCPEEASFFRKTARGNVCVAICYYGYTFGGQCLDGCPSDTYVVNKTCVQSCPSNLPYKLKYMTYIENEDDKRDIFKCVHECPTVMYCNTLSCTEECHAKALNRTCRDECPCKNECRESCPIEANKVFNRTCVTECPTGMYTMQTQQTNTYTCHNECPNDLFSYKNECVLKCPIETKMFNHTCAVECPTGMYTFQDKCVYECPPSTIHNNTECKVLHCPKDYAHFNRTCVMKCPMAMLKVGDRCIPECPNNQYYYNTKCLSICPIDTFLYNHTCFDNCPHIAPFKYDACDYRTYGTSCWQPSNKRSCVDKCPDSPSLNFTCVKSCPKSMALYNQTCVNNCPQIAPFKYDACDFEMSCWQQSQHKTVCVDKCPYSISVNFTCIKSCPKDKFIYNKTCVDNCPQIAPFKYDCDFRTSCYLSGQQNTLCVDKCPDSFSVNVTCVKRCPSNLILFNSQCLDSCPDGYFWWYSSDTYSTNGSCVSFRILNGYIIGSAVSMIFLFICCTKVLRFRPCHSFIALLRSTKKVCVRYESDYDLRHLKMKKVKTKNPTMATH